MKCTDFDLLLCDAVDGTLNGEPRQLWEQHRSECAECRALAVDVLGATAFLRQVEAAEPSPELLSRIAFQIPRAAVKKPAGGFHLGWLPTWMSAALQPRFAMGMAMTILSFSMLGRLAGFEVRQLRPADLDPASVWSAFDDRVHRTWERAIKYYENIRLVYEVQSRLNELNEEADRGSAGQRGTDAGSEPNSAEKDEKAK